MKGLVSRIETKVWAGVAGFLTGSTAFSPLVLWLLGVLVFDGQKAADAADATIAGVPWPVALAVTALLGSSTGAVAAYKAPPSNHAGNPNPAQEG